MLDMRPRGYVMCLAQGHSAVTPVSLKNTEYNFFFIFFFFLFVC